MPFFLKELEAPTPQFEMYESSTYVARQYIASSDHPSAVKYMISLLKNPKADRTQRFEAYGWQTLHVDDGNDIAAIDRARRVLVVIGSDTHTLDSGDAIYFDSSLRHGYRRAGGQASTGLIVTIET